MLNRNSRYLSWQLVALIGFGISGCQRAAETTRVPVNTPEVVAHRAQFQLAGEPAGALPLGELSDLLKGTASDPEASDPEASDPEASDPEASAEADSGESAARDVIFVARVGGVPPGGMGDDQDFPWEPGRAAFVVSDPTLADPSPHDHAGGSHDDCPFCAKKKAAGPLALVQCLGTDGEALDVDARDLFTIAENDVVVVEGRARMAGDTLIVVDAKGVFVRR